MTRRPPGAAALLVAGALAVAGAGAGCGDTREDTAKDRGEDVGAAVREMVDARSADELQAATAKLKESGAAVAHAGGHRVQDQLRTQQNSVNQAIGDVRQTLTSGDANAASTARTQLQDDLQDIRAQAQAFQSSNDSVANAFWDGVKDGYDGD
jgi:uncharacterized protein involved in exopolysaccharide biosynthesis